ncbi:MAG: sulfotransferase family protein [bacterium]
MIGSTTPSIPSTSGRDQLPETPFFVVGNPRSGTTLLRFILSSHPRIYIPGETGFLPFLLKHVQSELSLPQVRGLLHRIAWLNRGWDDLIEQVPGFYSSLPAPTLRHLIDALYRRKIAPHGAVRWGDKTPSYVRYIPELSAIFPETQFIHLIRDGRDVALSAQAKWGDKHWYMDSYYLLKNWARNVKDGRQAGRQLGPDRYLEIHYEQLVQAPEDTVRRLCGFLNESFHSAMLQHTRLARQEIAPDGHVEVRNPISTASVQRWRDEMSAFQCKLANELAGPVLTEAGYEPSESSPWSTREHIRLFSLAVKYQAIDSMRHVLPSLGIPTLNRDKRKRGLRALLRGALSLPW